MDMTQKENDQFNELVMAHLDKVGASYLKNDVYSSINHVMHLNTGVGGFRIHLPKKRSNLYCMFCRFEQPNVAWIKFPHSNQYTGKFNHYVGTVDNPEEAAQIMIRQIDYVIRKSQS